MLDVKEREESKDNLTFFFGLSQNTDEDMFYLVGERALRKKSD